MRIWILASAASLAALAGFADAPSAAEPWGAPQRSSAARAPIFPAAHAWVNSLKQEVAPAPPAPGPALRPAIAGNSIGQGSGGTPGENGYAAGATIAPTAWNHEHVYSGYVFGPGSCDHTPPCVNHLWDGYCQRPCRCGHGLHFQRQCFQGCGGGGGCATCGQASVGCSSCGGGGHFGCHACSLHQFKHRLASTFDMGCNTCGNSCGTTCAPACGCGHKLFGGLHRGWFGNLCSACDGGMSCGCSDGLGGSAPSALPNSPAPELVPKPALNGPPEVPADDAKSARRSTRFVSGSLN